MSEFKGTKGRWIARIGSLGIDIIQEKTGFGIADIGSFEQLKDADYPKEQAEANAKLIASAPELLEMLISLEPHLRLNSQEEINKWKSAKQLISKITE